MQLYVRVLFSGRSKPSASNPTYPGIWRARTVMEAQSNIPTNLGFVMEAQCIESATTYQIFLSSNPAACKLSFWVGIGKIRRREMIRGDGRCCRRIRRFCDGFGGGGGSGDSVGRGLAVSERGDPLEITFLLFSCPLRDCRDCIGAGRRFPSLCGEACSANVKY